METDERKEGWALPVQAPNTFHPGNLRILPLVQVLIREIHICQSVFPNGNSAYEYCFFPILKCLPPEFLISLSMSLRKLAGFLEALGNN